MKKTNVNGLVCAALAAFSLLAASPAGASVTVSAGGGSSTAGGTGASSLDKTTLLLSGELTYGLGDVFQVGGFIDHNSFSVTGVSGATSALNFYGAVARLGFGAVSDFFLDAKLGLAKWTGTDSALGFGAGLGYKVGLAPFVSFKPRVGFRSVPVKVGSASSGATAIDVAALLSFSI